MSGARWEFGGYEIVSELGRGGMGVVFKALQRNLDRTVALKLFLSESNDDPKDLVRFEREAVAAARVDHPNIVRIYEAGRIHGQSYFAMEHVEGSDLAQLTAAGPLAPRESARLVVRVARAVQHLHDQGILHRDLKPSNILVDAAGQPKVTDFGIARIVGSEGDTTTGTVFGSPSYMAPEQATGSMGPPGPLTDVFGLGAVLYRLLTGTPPHAGENAMETMLQAIRGTPRPPRSLNPAVPVQLEAICLKCLEKAPRRRYSCAGEVGADLERFLSGEVVEAARHGPWTRLRRWIMRETSLAVHVLMLGLVALGKGVACLFAPGPEHVLVLGGLALWSGCCVVLQRVARRWTSQRGVGSAWGVLDVVFLTVLLLGTNGITSPALLGYPLIVMSAGLWMRLQPVSLTCFAAFAGYLLLAVDSFLWHPGRRLAVDGYVIVGAGILMAGLLMVRQVRRARALGRFRG